jgi:hypothetical protein
MECGWWTDRSLKRLSVDPSLMRIGKNEIVLKCNYDENHPGLEAIYLLGSFGTKVKDTKAEITAMPASLKLGDWVKQGLAFYSGSVSYIRQCRLKRKKGERIFVEVPDYRGTAVRVLVNGKPAGVTAWEPNEVDITDLVDGKPAEVRIEVIGHRRNSHGPLHTTEKWPRWVGPAQFVTEGKEWQEEYQLVPCGLMAPPRLIVRK